MSNNILGFFDLIPKIGEQLSYEKMQMKLHNAGLMKNDVDCAYNILVKMLNDEGTELRCASVSDEFEANLRQKGFKVQSQINEGTDENPWDMKWVTVRWPKEDNVPRSNKDGASLPTRLADREFVRDHNRIGTSFNYNDIGWSSDE